MKRPSFDETAMTIARTWAERSTCSARASVGAVLVNYKHRVVAAGYNGAPSGFAHCNDVGCVKDSAGHCIVAIHAEENALLQCAADGIPTYGLILYVTHSPCVRCALRLIQAGVAAVFYGVPYGSESDCNLVAHWFELAGVPFKKVGEDESLQPLLPFIDERPDG